RAVAWAWESDLLAFVGRRGVGLRLLMVDVITGDLAHDVDLPFHDAFSVTVSADGDTVALVGVTDGQADLYAYAPASEEWRRVTNDPHLDADPMLDPTGSRILYVSERGGQTRLIRTSVGGSDAEEVLLDGAGGIHDPQWADDSDGVIFTADWTGSRDVYLYPTPDGRARRLTNLISGAGTPALAPDGESMSFSASQGGRQTVFVLPMSGAEREPTDLPGQVLAVEPDAPRAERADARDVGRGLILDDVRFAFHTPADGVPRAAIEATATSWTGNARMRLSVSPTPSDVPGARLSAEWLRGRADFSLDAMSRAVFHRDALGARATEREEDVRAAAAYPLSVRRRLVLSAAATRAPLTYRYAGVATESASDDPTIAGVVAVALVHDTVAVSTRLGPVTGSRYRIEVSRALGGDDVDSLSFTADARKYARLGSSTVFAMRLMGSRSDGDTPKLFYLGGHTSLRASEFEALSGARAMLASVELRVPLLNELRLAWPIEAGIRGVRGVLFAETGMAWNEGDKPRIARRTDDGLRLQDLIYEFGFGARARVLGLRLRWDMARGYDFVYASGWRSTFRVDSDF
ncbi:BamA/TamA family outer membrane protein, partial [Candidatus Poribacteria bacterium]|nr:BamA/TamA family outer membrane protein [Candidatus Poribacteria bacterium]